MGEHISFFFLFFLWRSYQKDQVDGLEKLKSIHQKSQQDNPYPKATRENSQIIGKKRLAERSRWNTDGPPSPDVTYDYLLTKAYSSMST